MYELAMKYYSTNHSSSLVSFKEALLQGQAPDRGLYMPEIIPQISHGTLFAMRTMDYPDVAFTVLREFLKNEISEDILRELVQKAYTFDIPLEHITDKTYIMRLDQGPTASFKDFGARMLAQLMNYFLQREHRRIIILTATSGDTGSAVANAFYGLENVSIVVLFPRAEVTERQRKQMTTLGKNVFPLAVEGKFDDCQAMVKQAFDDSALSALALSSANSINIGRLLPQSVYYFYAYTRIQSNQEEIVFSVPCGNFGNLMGGLFAKHMGLPVRKFIAGTNENDEVPRFFKTAQYAPIQPSKICISNAMNVGHPSNLARIVSLYGGHMDEKGKIHKAPDMKLLNDEIYATSVSDQETRETIYGTYKSHDIILEPHGAVAFAALHRFPKEPSLLCVSLETAHPAKFPGGGGKGCRILDRASKEYAAY